MVTGMMNNVSGHRLMLIKPVFIRMGVMMNGVNMNGKTMKPASFTP